MNDGDLRWLSDKNRNRLLNVTLVFLSVNLAFAGLEIGLRAGIIPDDRSVSSEDIRCSGPEALHQFHPEYGWTLSPNATYLRQWQKPNGEDDVYLFETNEDGFRDTYDSGERNVIVVGDSFTEGAGVTQGGQYATLLDHWFPNTSFHAYGAGGYGTDQELLTYRNVSDQYDHELVILAYYYGNDANNNVGEGWPPGPRRPQFELRDGRLVQVHEPVDRMPEGAAGFRDHGLVGSVHRTALDTSRAYHWTYRRARTIASQVGLVGGGESGPPSPPTGDSLQSQLRLTGALLGNLSEEAADHDAEVLVVGIPARGEVTPDNPAHYPSETGIPYYRAQRRMLENVTESHDNLGHLDLKPALNEEIKQGQQVYGREVANAHFISHGYKLMAREIHERITDDGYVPDRPADLDADYRRQIQSCP